MVNNFSNDNQTPFNVPYSPLNANSVFAADNPDYQKLRVIQADVDYFITLYGETEALQLTNAGNPASNTIKIKKIQYALEDAFALILSYYGSASQAGQTLIMSSFRRTQAIFARYFLDTSAVRPRTHVVESFERAIEQLQLWAATSSGQSLLKFTEAYQFYQNTPYGNGVSLIKSSHEHKRKFTAASLEPWVEGCASNDVYHPLRYHEVRFMPTYQTGASVGSLPDPETSPTGTVFAGDADCIDQYRENYDFDCPTPDGENAEDIDCNDTVVCDSPANLVFGP